MAHTLRYSEKDMPTFAKPKSHTVRIRVQDIEGQLAVKTKSLTMYDTDADTEYQRIVEMYETEIGEKKPVDKPQPKKK